jgi:hypothetical protein
MAETVLGTAEAVPRSIATVLLTVEAVAARA